MNSPYTSVIRTFSSGTESLVPPKKPCWRCLIGGVRSLILIAFHNWNTRQLLRGNRGQVERIFTSGDAVVTGVL